MSNLRYYAYEGTGTYCLEHYYYNQAVRISAGADRVELSGQGGWDPKTTEVKSELLAEIDQAFANVELALRDAGVKDGWKNVFRVNSYHKGFDGNQEQVMGSMIGNFRKYMPNHAPIWTCVGVTTLALPTMNIEIEVVAFDQK